MYRDIVKGTSKATLYKFYDPHGIIAWLLERGTPIEDVVKVFKDALVGIMRVEGNVFLNEGINFIWQAITGASGLTYFGSNSCIGVGDGTTSEDPSQTGLMGQNKYYKQVDSGYPQVSGTQATFQATFGPNEANFNWQEWTIANGCSDSAVNLNRKVSSLGSKPSGATWTLKVAVTIS